MAMNVCHPKLVDEIVCEVKSQGVFEQFRRNCNADVDTKPAYHDLRQRVQNIVSNFLSNQVWRPDLNRKKLRKKLRKQITKAVYLQTDVNGIVDQVVNPKINSVFSPKIEDISYKYLGIEKPKSSNEQILFKSEPLASQDTKLPTALPIVLYDSEAVSPDATCSDDSFPKLYISINSDSVETELNDSDYNVDDVFESPTFNPLKGSLLNESDSIYGELDFNIPDISRLTSHSSEENFEQPKVLQETEINNPTIEIIRQPAVTQQVIPKNVELDFNIPDISRLTSHCSEQNFEQPKVLQETEIKNPTIEIIRQPAVTQQVIPKIVNQDSGLSIVNDSNDKNCELNICQKLQLPKSTEYLLQNVGGVGTSKRRLLTVVDTKQEDEIKLSVGVGSSQITNYSRSDHNRCRHGNGKHSSLSSSKHSSRSLFSVKSVLVRESRESENRTTTSDLHDAQLDRLSPEQQVVFAKKILHNVRNYKLSLQNNRGRTPLNRL